VLVVDDHRVVRQGLIRLLKAEPDIDVVGEAADGRTAVALTRELAPDVVTMDIEMPGMNGIEATRLIHGACPDVCVIGLSIYEEAVLAAAMRNAGAVNYLTKSGPFEDLVAAIRSCVRAASTGEA
jgi:DNA-binding NarL/FixJ family response regulator